MNDIGHYKSPRTNDPETISRTKEAREEIRYYIPGIFSQSTITFSFYNHNSKSIDARARIHVTGIIERPKRQILKRLKYLGYK